MSYLSLHNLIIEWKNPRYNECLSQYADKHKKQEWLIYNTADRGILNTKYLKSVEINWINTFSTNYKVNNKTISLEWHACTQIMWDSVVSLCYQHNQHNPWLFNNKSVSVQTRTLNLSNTKSIESSYQHTTYNPRNKNISPFVQILMQILKESEHMKRWKNILSECSNQSLKTFV